MTIYLEKKVDFGIKYQVLKADSPDYNDPAAMRDYVERSRKAIIRIANRLHVVSENRDNLKETIHQNLKSFTYFS